MDGDGGLDIAATDRDANLYWIRTGQMGQYLEDLHMQVPRLKVRLMIFII
jgi:hypothetical protein